MKTGRKILNLRRDLGVAQKALADLTAVTPSALSRIEAGQNQPRGSVVLRIARGLGVTVDYLLDENAPYPPPDRELLANLVATAEEERTERIAVSRRERRLLEALRKLDGERTVLLEGILAAERPRIRYASHVLGIEDQLPGIDDREREAFLTEEQS